ncbi:putative glycoside hydrolase [Nonomuraea sp. NPDC049607]|uniref:putative glycoside hydrolase n=1 Tax=Nonomuraea sp. NPDC049607 TaxID=3154732 RepID=UPI0034393403
MIRLVLAALAVTLVLPGTAHAARGTALVLPDPPAHGIARAQVFDSQVPDKSVYQGKVSFTWGAYPITGQPAGLVPSRYMPVIRDNSPDRPLAWYQTNHPDWIMYKEDRVTPVLQSGSSQAVTLDVANPAARQFMLDNLVKPAAALGYQVIAMDNVVPWNWTAASGHYDQAGTWVQQYASGTDDPAYAAAFLDYLCWMKKEMHKLGLALAGNISPLGVNAWQRQQSAQAVQIVDLWLHEGGFTRARDANITDDEWAQTFALYRSVVGVKPVVTVNQTTTTALADAGQQQVDWIIANYLLVREQRTMLTLCGRNQYGVWLDRPELDVDLGTPTGAPVQDASGAWRRDYQLGKALVNPSSTQSATVTLPPGTWTDSHGVAHTGQVTLIPNSGLILTS